MRLREGSYVAIGLPQLFMMLAVVRYSIAWIRFQRAVNMKMLKIFLMGMALAMSGLASAATVAYSMKVAVTFPKGTAGEKLATAQPSNTKMTPCTASKVDAVTLTLTYTVADPADKDTYIIAYNPETSNYYVVTRSIANNDPTRGFTIVNRASAGALLATDIYRSKAQNTGGTITETLFGATLLLDYLNTGTWQIIGILADSANVDFKDTSTWTAWDVATLVVGSPWMGTVVAACTP